MSTLALISLGSNIGDRRANLRNAVEALKMIRSPGWVWPAGLFQQPLGINR